MKLEKKARLTYELGTSKKIYEAELCEVGDDQYVVNYRYGREGGNFREGSKTVSPVTWEAACNIFDHMVTSKVEKGYTVEETEGDVDIPESASEPAVSETTERYTTSSSSRGSSSGSSSSGSSSSGSSSSGGDSTAPTERAEGASQYETGGGDGPFPPAADDPRVVATLERLSNGVHHSDEFYNWSMSRAIWRAGEMQIAAAEPTIHEYIGREIWKETLAQRAQVNLYSALWALGRLGGEASRELLRGAWESDDVEMIRRVAGCALRELEERLELDEFARDVAVSLPGELADPALEGDAEAFADALAEYAENLTASGTGWEALEKIYLVDSETTRPAFVDVLRGATIQPGWWRLMRHLYKMAELRRDPQVFGIINRKVFETRHRYEHWRSFGHGVGQRSHSGVYVRPVGAWGGQTISPTSIRSDNTEYGFSQYTKEYFERRGWRTLRRMGELGDPDYVKMAVGVLLQYEDDDLRSPWSDSRYRYDRSTRRWEREQIWYDRTTGDAAFNKILYGNSRRFSKVGDQLKCNTGVYRPDNTPRDVREEAFPSQWERVPVGLLHLLDESRCRPVHRFAVLALRACEDFVAELPLDALVMMLDAPYDITVEFGFSLVVDRYDPDNPNLDVLRAMANCNHEPAREQAYEWIQKLGDEVAGAPRFLAAMATSRYVDTLEFMRRFLYGLRLDDDVREELVGRMVATLLGLGEGEGERAAGITDILSRALPEGVRNLGFAVIRDLAEHPLAEVQEFAGEAMLARDVPARELPWDVIYALMGASHESVRAIGMRLFDQLDDDSLLEREELLAALCVHEHEDLRRSVRRTIGRLASEHPDFAARLIETLVDDVLMQEERHDGVHHSVGELLREELADHLGGVSHGTIFDLLDEGATRAARAVGGLLLSRNIDASDLDIEKIARLAGHEIVTVREAAHEMLAESVDRVRREPGAALRVLDSEWEDTRQWGFDFFRDTLEEDDLSPALLVSICDSIRPDVQRFGREMISRYFDEEHGEEYLLKLSEHPSQDLQLYATNYLERYAAGHPERLAELEHYFVSVLSRVNRARTAKDRVFAFLREQAREDEEAARVVARIMTRQSVTIAYGDRADAIEAMVGIREAFPEISLPIEIKAVEVRDGV